MRTSPVLKSALLTVLAFALSSVAIGDESRPSPSRPVSPKPAPTGERGLECTPKELSASKSLTIKLLAKHGSQLAIVDPLGRYFFLSFLQQDPTSPLQPIIPSELFNSMRIVSLDVGLAKGLLWSEGGKKSKIFVVSGSYQILLSDALETEDPILDGWCTVNFQK